MLFLLDANTLIDANRDYYPIARVPEFWEWLEHHGREGHIKLPLEIYEEVKEGNDDLAKWAKRVEVKTVLMLDEVAKLGRDPFLISYALHDVGQRCVVSTEGSKPSAQRANRRIPDVCKNLGIPCCNTFQMLRTLEFSTRWQTI